jgi:hypothetical protein
MDEFLFSFLYNFKIFTNLGCKDSKKINIEQKIKNKIYSAYIQGLNAIIQYSVKQQFNLLNKSGVL